jgi:hypothetical protein
MTILRSLALFLGVALSFSACAPDSGWAPNPDEPRAFVTTLGADTVAVEVYLRTDASIEGTLIERSPFTRMTDYQVDVAEDGSFTDLLWSTQVPTTNPDGPEIQGGRVTVQGDSALVVRYGGQNPGSSRVALPSGSILTLGRTAASAFAFEEVANRLLDGATSTMIMGPSGRAAAENNATVVAGDTVSMDYFGQARKAWTDGSGQLLAISGAGTTNSSETRRVKAFLVGSLADRWAAMDAPGEGMGVPSPAATTQATVEEADIEVNYSQPSKRDRDIWGNLVPNGSIWRTGANAATHFTTSRNLSFGEYQLPAGTYTLWSMYENGSFSLILNEQTNQWGTAHDAEQDLFAVNMTPETLSEVQERFVIEVTGTEEGGRLSLAWDTTRWSVPFSVN